MNSMFVGLFVLLMVFVPDRKDTGQGSPCYNAARGLRGNHIIIIIEL